jgi:membrane protein implicated in regulation of membrane protease activity
MGNCPLCNLEPTPKASGCRGRAGILRRAWGTVEWLFPAALMVLIPKCPLCVAADIALFSGIGVSVSTARWIQILMLGLYLLLLVYLVVKYCRKWVRARRQTREAQAGF